MKVGIGTEKKSRVISDKEKRITAFHEAGHAILFHVLPDVGPVYSVSIIPTGGAGGYTMPLPEQNGTCSIPQREDAAGYYRVSWRARSRRAASA